MNTAKNSFRISAFAAALFTMGSTLSAPAVAGPYIKYGDVKFGVESTASAFRGGVNVATGDINNDVHYVGRDGNWFNPSNWSSGRVPGANDNVILDGQDRVVIDPLQDPAATRVRFGDLVISSVAVLETLPGTVIENGNTRVLDAGQLIHRGSGALGDTLVVGGSSGEQVCVFDANGQQICTVPDDGGSGRGGGVLLNPTQQNKRIVVLQSSATVDVGLGGSEAASLTRDAAGGVQLNAGRGTYATTTVDTLVIDGDLKISTYHGFEPRPGQSFQIMTVNGMRSGEFVGLPEGGYVGCTEDNVGLRMSYVGGDGNDLVISAEQTEPGICLLLPAVQKVREAAARTASIDARIDRLPRSLAAAVDEGVSQTREHILLARQVGVLVVEETASKLPSPTTPISGPKPTPK